MYQEKVGNFLPKFAHIRICSIFPIIQLNFKQRFNNIFCIYKQPNVCILKSVRNYMLQVLRRYYITEMYFFY